MGTATDRTGAARLLALPLLVAAIWGGLVPFIGPSFNFKMGGDGSWVWSESHASLHLAPAVVAAIGALAIIRARSRRGQAVGAALAMLAGIWFIIAPSLHPLWTSGQGGGMMMMGSSKVTTALEALGYHYGVGAVITSLGGIALGLALSNRDRREVESSASRVETRATDDSDRPSLIDA